MSVGQYALVAEQLSETLAKAVVVWTGYGVTAHPERDENRVVEQFGAEAAGELMPLINALEDDFYGSTAHQTVHGLNEMVAQAANEFRVRHPEISEAVVDALAWRRTRHPRFGRRRRLLRQSSTVVPQASVVRSSSMVEGSVVSLQCRRPSSSSEARIARSGCMSRSNSTV